MGILFKVLMVLVVPVHVTLFSVTYNASQDAVNLRWIAEREENGDRFIIERSADSVHFVKAGEVAGRGPDKTPRHYDFDDPHPLSGKLFYRLHLVSAGGRERYTPVVSVYKEISKMEVSPLVRDTASQTIFFSIVSPGESNANITLADYAGKVIKSYFIPLKKGSNYQSAYIGNLGPGVYFLQVNDKNGGGSVMQQFSKE